MIPAVFDVVFLAWIIHVFAAGRADYRQFADRAARHFVAAVIHHLRAVARHHLANGTLADVPPGGRNEDVKHFSGTNAVKQLDAGRVAPQRAGGIGQALASADTNAQGGRPPLIADLFHVRRHLPVKRRCGVADGGGHLMDEACHCRRRVGLIRKIDRRPGPHRKNQHPAQPEGKRQRW